MAKVGDSKSSRGATRWMLAHIGLSFHRTASIPLALARSRAPRGSQLTWWAISAGSIARRHVRLFDDFNPPFNGLVSCWYPRTHKREERVMMNIHIWLRNGFPGFLLFALSLKPSCTL